MRGIKDRLITELASGKLAWITEELGKNPALYLSIGENCVDIYYRGTSILMIKPGGGYAFTVQEKHFTTDELKEELSIFNRDKKAVGVYQRKFPVLTQAMDASFATMHHAHEETKQNIAAANANVVLMDYPVGDTAVEMIAVFDNRVVAVQGNPASVKTVYDQFAKAMAIPEEKANLVGSVKAVMANLVAMGKLEAELPFDENNIEFLAIVPEGSADLAGDIPVKSLVMAAGETSIDYSKAQ